MALYWSPFLSHGTFNVSILLYSIAIALLTYYRSLEYRDLLVHGMDRPWMSEWLHQLDHMER